MPGQSGQRLRSRLCNPCAFIVQEDATSTAKPLTRDGAVHEHDLVNTIGVLMNYAALIGQRVTDPSAVAYLKEIRTEAERAIRTARQLLAEKSAPLDGEGDAGKSAPEVTRPARGSGR